MKKKYVDSNVFIQAVLRHDKYAVNVLEKIANKEFIAVTSILSWDELVFILRKYINKNTAVLQGKKFLLFPNVEFIDAKKEIIFKAQELVERYNILPRDAIHCATSLHLNINEIISEDNDFDKIKELKRTNPKEL